MEWWIIAALTGIVLLLIQMYRLALREVRALTNYALLMLVEEGVYGAQRASLVAFVRASEAKNAAELGGQAYFATSRLIQSDCRV